MTHKDMDYPVLYSQGVSVHSFTPEPAELIKNMFHNTDNILGVLLES